VLVVKGRFERLCVPGDVSTSAPACPTSRFREGVSCGDIPAFDPVSGPGSSGNVASMASDCVHHHPIVFRRACGEAKNHHQMNLQIPTSALVFSANTLLDFLAVYALLRGECCVHRSLGRTGPLQCQSRSQLKVHNFWGQRHWGTLGEVRRGLGW